jgi:RHS repeat-associated protein
MLDNRIGMDENGTQTWTLYDGSDPIMDFNGSGSLAMRYLNGPTGDLVDTIIARESAGGTIAWYLPDRLGTVRDLINNSGSIIDHVDYSAFGTVLDESSPSNGDRMMGFAGMERDSVTGLNLAVNRVQDPGTGRWESEDPLGFGGGDTNLYRYASNAPTAASDPMGEAISLPPLFPDKPGPYGDVTDGPDSALKQYWLQISINDPKDWDTKACQQLLEHFKNLNKLYNNRLKDYESLPPYMKDDGHYNRLVLERTILTGMELLLGTYCGMRRGAFPIGANPSNPWRPPQRRTPRSTQIPAPVSPIFPAEPGFLFPRIYPGQQVPPFNPKDTRTNPGPVTVPRPVGVPGPPVRGPVPVGV